MPSSVPDLRKPLMNLLELNLNIREFLSYTAIRQLSQMLAAIIFFHLSEFISAIAIHGIPDASLRSLLISRNYLLAMLGSMLEYSIEIVLFPDLKNHWWISDAGLALVIIGELIRKTAIATAGRAFTHLIKTRHEEEHLLVTNGVYGVVRHPGCCGFLVWVIGVQVMVVNPVCCVAFGVVFWKFFARRIVYEESYLGSFFGEEYVEYVARVPSGVPFVR